MKLATLTGIYDEFNRSVFASVLDRPFIRNTRSRGEYASYVASEYYGSTIYFNAAIIAGHWARSIVFHEMVHQYVEEFLELEEDNHHGEIFWRNYRIFAPTNIILFEGL